MQFSNGYDINISRMCSFTDVVRSVFHAQGCFQSPESPEKGLILVLSVTFDLSSALVSTFGLVSLCTFSLALICSLKCQLLYDVVLCSTVFYRGCLKARLCWWDRNIGCNKKQFQHTMQTVSGSGLMRHPIVNTKHGFILDTPPRLILTCMSKIEFLGRILL